MKEFIEAQDGTVEKMTIDEWKEAVQTGCYNEYDGGDHYGTDSEIFKNTYCFDKAPDKATHVYWYNK